MGIRGGEILLLKRRRRRSVGDVVLPDHGTAAGDALAGQLAGGVLRVHQPGVGVEPAVGPHHQVVDGAADDVRQVGQLLLGQVVLNPVDRGPGDLLVQGREAEQRPGGRRHVGVVECIAARVLLARAVADEADVILHHPEGGRDRLQTDEPVGRRAAERRVEHGRQLLVRRDRHVIALRRPRRAGRHLGRTDERIEHADRPLGEVVKPVALPRRRLVGGPVLRQPRVAAHVHQLALGVEHRERQIAAEAVGVVDVEHGGPGLQAVAQAADHLDVLVGEVHGIPIDVGGRGEGPGDADRIAIRGQQVAQFLRGRQRLVRPRLGVLAEQRRVQRQSLHVDTDDRKADVRVADRRAGLLVPLLEADPQFVAAARGSLPHAGDVGHRRFQFRRRGRGRHPRLAPHPHEVLCLDAGRAREHDPHPRITGVLRVVVRAEGGIVLQVAAEPASGSRQGRIGLAVERPRQHRARGIEQFDHRVERRRGLVDVEPDLAARIAVEAVDVHVRAVIGRHVAVDLETEPTVVVAPLLHRRQHAEVLGGKGHPVDIDAAGQGGLRLGHDRYVAVVRVGQEPQAAPIGGGARGGPVTVGVLHGDAQRVAAGADGIVGQRREHDRIPGLAEHLHRAADAVVDVGGMTGGREPGRLATELDHEAGVRAAHQPHAGRRVEVVHHDLAGHDVDDVRVVPHALDVHLAAADDHAADRAGVRRSQRVAADERTEVVVELRKPAARPRAPARIGHSQIGERIDVDADHGSRVAPEVVADDDRLRPADEDRGGVVRAPARAIGRGLARRVVLQTAVGQPQPPLMGLDDVEAVEAALDRGLAAAVGDVGVVDARLGGGIDDDAAPVTRRRLVGQRTEQVEGTPRPEAVVGGAGEDHAILRIALGDQFGVAATEFDAGSLELHDHARIDLQPARGPGEHVRAVGDVAAGAAIDEHVLGEHVGDVPRHERRRHVERVDRLAELGANPHEQSVDRVVGDAIATDRGPAAAGGLLEAVGISRHRRPGTEADRVEGERRPGGHQVDRREGLQLAVDQHLPAAVLHHRLGDAVEKHPLARRVGVAAHHDAAPLAARPDRPDAVAVTADAVVVVRGELHLVERGAEHLERGPAARDEVRGTAHVDDLRPQFEHGAFVDHHGDVRGHHEITTVGQGLPAERGADQIGLRRGRGAGGVAHDAHDLLAAARPRREALLDRGERPGERAVARAADGSRGHFVHKDGVGRRGRLEPEVERAPRDSVAVAVDRRALRVHDRVQGRRRRHETHPQPIGPVRPAVVAAVLHRRIEVRVGAGDGHVVGVQAPGLVPRRQIEADERVAAVEVVVPRHQFAGPGGRILAVEREHSVGQARHRLAGTGDDGLQRHLPVGRQREGVGIDVGAVLGMQDREVDDVVVAGDHVLVGRLLAHVRLEVVGMPEAEDVADLVHGHVVPGAAELALPPVERAVHDRYLPDRIGDAGRAVGHRGVGIHRADVAGHHGNPRRGRFDEADARIQAVQIEDLAGPLLLVLGDRVEERIALGIKTVVDFEVVGHGRRRARRQQVGRGHQVRLEQDRDLPMTRLVHRAGLRGEQQVPQRGGHARPHIDHGVEHLAADTEHAEAGRRGEARVLVARRRPGV